MYLRRIYRPNGQGFVVNYDPSNPMGLIIGSGTYNDFLMEAISIVIPIADVEQNVLITLQDDPISPIHMSIVRNYIDDQPSIISTSLVVLANCWVPPNCTDLKTIDVYTRGFVNDKLYETPFEGGQPVWEIVQ